MYAVEFQTHISNGTIRIPTEHQGSLSGAVRVIVLAEEPVAPEANGAVDSLAEARRRSDEEAIERGLRAMRQADLDQPIIAAGWDAAMREMGIPKVPWIGAEKLQEMMIAEGIDPNDNSFSRGIIEMREE